MISVEGAGFRFDERWIYRGVSFEADKGDMVAILGPNGRGKTTLLKAVVGLLTPEEGRVQTRGRIGYVPQRAEVAFAYKVIDMVVMGRAAHIGAFRSPGSEDYEIARTALDQLGLGDFAERPFDRLSGGERQLVLIARALASDCDLLVLDEPASSLDFRNQDIILSTLRRVAAENGLTVLLTTHFPQHAIHLANKVLLMHDVDRHLWGKADEMLTEHHLEALYGLPIRKVHVDHGGQIASSVIPIFSQS